MVPQARGVVAVCTPWNAPVAVPSGLLAAALVTGNTVVFKPSERTPLTASDWLGL
jgi:acyl-CoA reductase-like NAD-dependent aldehyde dehydrogenase